MWSDVPTLIAGQFVGRLHRRDLVYLAYLVHWGRDRRPRSEARRCSRTGPAIRNTGANLITEIIGTALLLFGIVLAISSAAVVPASVLARRRSLVARHRHVARWTDRLRDQPGARPRAAHHARRSCRSPARVDPTGSTHGSRSSARSSAASSARCSPRRRSACSRSNTCPSAPGTPDLKERTMKKLINDPRERGP